MSEFVTPVPPVERDEMRAAVENMKRNLPAFIEQAAVLAKIRKASYDAHIGEGFTPEQALTLCASMLM